MGEVNNIKIVMLGDIRVGKTSICEKYVNAKFDERYIATVGVKVYKKEISEKQTRLFIWDIANDSIMNIIPIEYLQGMQAALIVADIAHQSSIRNISQHINTALHVNSDVKAAIILNKTDLQPAASDKSLITVKEIMQFYSSNLISEPFLVSAKCDDDFTDIFMKISESVSAEESL